MDEMTDQYALCRNSGDEPKPPDWRELALVLLHRHCGSGLVVYSEDEANRAKKVRYAIEMAIDHQRIVKPMAMGS